MRNIFFILCGFFGILPTWSTEFDYSISQLTNGPKHHFFGYIGQSLTIPWNASGRFILCLETDFHDHMPQPDEAARVCLIDTRKGNEVIPLDESRAYNFQQGTMFYWNPGSPENQFFFNDRDLKKGKVFTVLYDVEHRHRVREFRFEETPVGNSGVAPNGKYFLAINYARMDRLRPVTGYPGAFDWTVGEDAPADDGIFRVNIESGSKALLVSFAEMKERFKGKIPDVEMAALYINHTLWNRDSDRIYFFLRGRLGEKEMHVNTPCTIHPDGSNLMFHETFIGGHPEWGEGTQIIGRGKGRQTIYDVDRKEVVGSIGNEGDFPQPEGDISLSPDGRLFANGFGVGGGQNEYIVYRPQDGTRIRTPPFSRGPYKTGELRIDPAPSWNRTSDQILATGWCEDGTRQMFAISLFEK